MDAEPANTTLVLTKEVLRQSSPKELLLADHFDPQQRSYGSTAKGPLGFGIDAAIPLLLPIVYLFFDGFIDELKHSVKKLGEDAADTLIAKVARTFAPSSKTELGDKPAELIELYLVENGVERDRATDVSKVIVNVLDKNIDKLKSN